MRSLLICLAAVTLTAATWESNSVRVFSPSREYRYEYESQVLTGISTLNKQYSGLKVKAGVVLHILDDKYVTLKLAGVEVFSVKEEPGVTPTAFVSPSLLEPIPAEHSSVLIESLVVPIKFRYETGLVTKVYAVGSDPYWSVNMKRGILSLVNLDLNAENPVPVDYSVSKSFMNMVRPDYNMMTTKTSYRVVEPSTLGDCETLYSLVPIPSASKMIVSKVIDTKRCSPKVMGESGILAGVMFGKSKEEWTGMEHPSISIDYELSGSRHEFLIKSAVLTGKYMFAPVVKGMTSVDGYVIQMLTYIKDEPIDRPITFDSTPIPVKKGLHAYIPVQSLVTMESFNSMRMGEDSLERAKTEMIDNLLEVIVEKTSNKVSKEVPDLISTLVTILRKMSKPEIMEIVTRHFSTKASFSGPSSIIEKKQTIIMDVLSTLPHPEAPIILVEMVKKGYIVSDVYGSLLINVASLVATPSPAVISAFVQMSKDPVIRSKPSTFRSVILGAGILSNKLVNLHMKMEIPEVQTATILKGVVKEIKAMLETSVVEEKIAVIKAIGNTGIIDFIPDLERIVKDKSHKASCRKEAIYAMRKMTVVAPIAIQSVALPVYLDVNEIEENRVAAFMMIMETKPSFAVVHMIGRSINYEPNKEIAAFTYRYLQNMATTVIPELKPLAVVVKRVLLIVKPIVSSPVLTASAFRWEAFSASYGIGSSVSVDKVQKVSRSIPSSLIGKLNLHLSGKSLKVIEGGLQITGLDEVVRKLIGTNGIIGDLLSGRADVSQIFDALTIPDMGQVEDVIRTIISQTDLPTPFKDIIRVVSCVKVLDQEINYVSLSKEDIIGVINSAKTSAMEIADILIRGYNVDIVKAIPLIDNAVVVPTPIGLPITVNLTAVTVVAIKGNVKLGGISSIGALWGSPAKVTIGASLRPSIHTDIYQTVGIHHDIIQIGTTVKGHVSADLPTSIEVIVDKMMEKVSLKINVPKEATPRVAVAVKPLLFKHFVPLQANAYSVSMYDIHLPKTMPIICDAITKPVSIMTEAIVPIISMKAKVSGVVSYPVPPVVDPFLVAISRHELEVSLEPTSSTPEAVLVEVIYEEKKIVTRRSEASGGWLGGWFASEDQVEEVVVSGEFIPVVPSPLVPNPITKRVVVNIMTVGGYNDAKIKTKLTLVHDPEWKIHQINCQIVGAPFVTPLWKVKVEAVVNIPKLLEAVIVAPKTPAPGVIAISEISFGVDRFTENTIVIKTIPVTVGDRPVWPMIESVVVPKTMKSVDLKVIVDFSRMDRNIKSASVRVVKMVVPVVMPYVVPYLFKEESTETNAILNSAESVEAIIQIVPKIYKINAVIVAPTTRLFFAGIPIPMVTPFTQFIVPVGVDLTTLPTFPMVTSLTAIPEDIPSTFYGICVAQPGNITTLDNITLPVPEIDSSCEIVLAHDCSPQKLYTVVSTPVSPAGVRTIKVVVPHFKVEISHGLVHQGVVIKVNDAITSIPVTRPLIITRPITGKPVPVLNITSSGFTYIITAPTVGVSVVTDGSVVKVKVSPVLRSTACGLCNHIPTAPVASGPSIVPTVTGTYSIVPVLPRYVVKSAQCPAVRIPEMPRY